MKNARRLVVILILNIALGGKMLQAGAPCFGGFSPEPAPPLNKACYKNDLEQVKEILNEGQFEINSVDHLGKTPLLQAITNDNDEIARILIEHGADLNQYRDSIWFCFNSSDDSKRRGKTFIHFADNPMMGAARSKNPQLIELLLDYGADIHSRNLSDGATVLHAAVESRQIENWKLLVANGANISALNTAEESLLYTAIKSSTYTDYTAHLETKHDDKMVHFLVKQGLPIEKTDLDLAWQEISRNSNSEFNLEELRLRIAKFDTYRFLFWHRYKYLIVFSLLFAPILFGGLFYKLWKSRQLRTSQSHTIPNLKIPLQSPASQY